MIHIKEQKKNGSNLMKDIELLDISYFNILDDIREHKLLQFCIIGLSGKFVPMLKENLNAKNLNFSIHLLNYIG